MRATSPRPVPPDPLELVGVVVAEQGSKALGSTPEMLLVPLTVCHQKPRKSRWIFCPEVLSHIFLAEKPAIVVEVDEAIEHVHAVLGWDVTKEVAVWVGPKDPW